MNSKANLIRSFFILGLFALFAVLAVPGLNHSAFAQPSAEKKVDVLTPVDEVVEEARSASQTLSILDLLTSSNSMDDEAYVGAQVKYQNAVDDISQIIRNIDEQSAAIAARLTEIGPPPEDSSVVEPTAVTETRAQLNGDKSRLAATKTELENLNLSAERKINTIAKARQDAFSEELSRRTEITTGLVDDGLGGISTLYASTRSHFKNWFSFVLSNKLQAALGSTIVSLLLALFLSFNFHKYFGAVLDRRDREPDYFAKVFTAFWATVLPSAAIAIFLAATYTLFTQFRVLTSTTAEIVLSAFLLIAGLVFGWNFCRAMFAPDAANWRLVATGNKTARRLFWIIFSLFTVYAFDSFISTVNSELSGPLSLTVLQGLVSTILIGLLLIALAWTFYTMQRRPHRQTSLAMSDEPETDRARNDKRAGLRRFALLVLIVLLAIGGAVLIVSSLAGYIGFSRFLARQLVVTGAILAIMFVGFVAARELAREGILANTGFGKRLIAGGYPPHRIEQASLVAGGLLLLLILSTGIPAILMQWGTRLEEVTAFAKRAFFGIDIGNIRISLSGILVGIVIFGIVLALTRLLQRWLGRSVFPRSNIDPGVSDSIKAGIGYVGFALAALLAFTSAGLDLSSLAIVAGALSLGIGFGLQNIVNNFVSGLILLVERPIKVGDWIVVGAAEGTVKRISVRATEIETFQRQSIIVPNSELINAQVGNWTFKSKHGRVDVNVGIAYGADIRLAEKILYEIAHEHAMVQKKPEPSVWFVDFGASSLDLRLRMFVYDINNLVTVETEVRMQILQRFGEAGIEIPFPQQDVHLRLPEGVPSLEEQVKAAEKTRKPPAKTATKPAAKTRKRTAPG